MAEKNKKKEINEEEDTMIETEKLPEDVVEEILSRLPVKSLLRFRCVCKRWFTLLKKPNFIEKQLSRSLASNSNISLIFTKSSSLFSVDVENLNYRQLKLPLYGTIRGSIRVLGSCEGLLCIYNINQLKVQEMKDDIVLWNPSIRCHQKLPIMPIEIPVEYCRLKSNRSYGFGYDPITKDYKLVCVRQFFSGDYHSLHSEVNVYSLSTDSWRRIGKMPFLAIRHNTGNRLADYVTSGILVNSVIHWIAEHKTGVSRPNVIVSFDLKDEEYREMPLPDVVDHKFHMSIEVLRGQLCMLCNFLSEGRAELWVMTDYGLSESWAKQFSIEEELVMRGRHVNYIAPICYSKKGEVLLLRHLVAQEYGEVYPEKKKDLLWLRPLVQLLFLYDPSRGRGRDLKSVTCRWETTYIESLIPLNAKDKN